MHATLTCTDTCTAGVQLKLDLCHLHSPLYCPSYHRTDEITTLLEFCLNATYSAFRKSLYQQVHGTAMGSPVSVVVADLVMEDVESRALTTFPSSPRFWKRYVDDTCCALRTDLVEDFHCHLNSIESSIQFTLETESDGQLAFLYMFSFPATQTDPWIQLSTENPPIQTST